MKSNSARRVAQFQTMMGLDDAALALVEVEAAMAANRDDSLVRVEEAAARHRRLEVSRLDTDAAFVYGKVLRMYFFCEDPALPVKPDSLACEYPPGNEICTFHEGTLWLRDLRLPLPATPRALRAALNSVQYSHRRQCIVMAFMEFLARRGSVTII